MRENIISIKVCFRVFNAFVWHKSEKSEASLNTKSINSKLKRAETKAKICIKY